MRCAVTISGLKSPKRSPRSAAIIAARSRSSRSFISQIPEKVGLHLHVHGGFRHARPERSEGAARRAGLIRSSGGLRKESIVEAERGAVGIRVEPAAATPSPNSCRPSLDQIRRIVPAPLGSVWRELEAVSVCRLSRVSLSGSTEGDGITAAGGYRRRSGSPKETAGVGGKGGIPDLPGRYGQASTRHHAKAKKAPG